MILHLYFARRFLAAFLAVFAIFLGIFILLDMVEQIRKFDSDSVGFVEIVKLTLLNVPQGLYRILPLIMILATVTLVPDAGAHIGTGDYPRLGPVRDA